MAKGGGLLIAADTGDGNAGTKEGLRGGMGVNFTGATNFREDFPRNIEELQGFLIIVQGSGVLKQ
ncbi:MAG: hypothetical protein ACRCSI_11980, partial [Eubacterium aggregans]